MMLLKEHFEFRNVRSSIFKSCGIYSRIRQKAQNTARICSTAQLELDYLQQIATQLMAEKERGEINIDRGRPSFFLLGGGKTRTGCKIIVVRRPKRSRDRHKLS